ncbi:hypothetical protein NUACC21_65920 [Scytonema sp. NUACC21]
MLLSTFELLVKPQLPSNIPSVPDTLSRTVIQGYFLTIANTNNSDIVVTLVFTAISPELNLDRTVTFVDVAGNNVEADITPLPGAGKRIFTINIGANDTILFILQPDITKNAELVNKNFEVRGYVEVFVSAPPRFSEVTLLITPEHRGTFFKDLNTQTPQLDQIAYGIPSATGSSLFKLQPSSPVPTPGRTYVVRRGDFLFSIAERAYGDGNRFSVICEANREVIGPDCNAIVPGQVLFIPAL